VRHRRRSIPAPSQQRLYSSAFMAIPIAARPGCDWSPIYREPR
jgi:hypothetical protein